MAHQTIHTALGATETIRPLDGVFVQAGLWRRAFGFVLDLMLIVVAVHFALVPIAAVLTEVFSWGYVDHLGPEGFFNLLVSPAGFIYYAVLEGVFGRTAGKWATGTRVITEAEQRPGGWVVIARTACRAIPFEFVSIYFSAERRSWHDQLSATYVVVHRV